MSGNTNSLGARTRKSFWSEKRILTVCTVTCIFLLDKRIFGSKKSSLRKRRQAGRLFKATPLPVLQVAIDRFQRDKSALSVIVFSEIKRCQRPHSTQFFQKAKLEESTAGSRWKGSTRVKRLSSRISSSRQRWPASRPQP